MSKLGQWSTLMEKEKMKLITQFILIVFNLISLVFMVFYSIFRLEGITSNVFAVMMSIVFVLNMIYASFTKNKLGFWLLISIMICLLLNYIGNFYVILSVFKSSISVLATCSLMLIPIFTLSLLTLDILGISRPIKHVKADKVIKLIVKIGVPIALFAIALLGYDMIFNYGYSKNEYSTTRGGVMFLFGGITLFLMLIRVCLLGDEVNVKESIKTNASFYLICVVLAGFSITTFTIPQTVISSDIKNAKTAYIQAFGDAIFESDLNLRNTPYSVADMYFGIPTTKYKVDRNIQYFAGTEGDNKNLKLAYDMYYPTFEGASKSVLVLLHGSGGDKDYKNSPQRCKYFASLGYIVYDIQYGDFKEKNTNYVKGVERKEENMLNHINKFFEYATVNNTRGANFESTFISGISMGGSLTLKIVLSFGNDFEQLGVNVKGMIPCYPGSSSGDDFNNYINYITKDSPPCLMSMGTHDGVVDHNTPFYVKDKYDEVGNEGFANIPTTYGGHGCDMFFVSRGGQTFTYFMERFMQQFR